MFEFFLVLGMVAGLLQIYLLLAWWGNGMLKTGEAVLLFGLDILLLAVMVKDPNPAVKMLVVLLLFSPYLAIHYMFNPGSIKEIYEEEIEKYRRMIHIDPRNLGAREYLAKTLYKLGDFPNAIAEMRTVVEMNPDDVNTRYILEQWESEKRETDTGLMVCPHCGHENECWRSRCRKCEKPVLSYRKDSWAGRLGTKGFIALFASVTVVIFSFAVLPIGWALAALACLLLAAAGWKMMSR